MKVKIWSQDEIYLKNLNKTASDVMEEDEVNETDIYDKFQEEVINKNYKSINIVNTPYGCNDDQTEKICNSDGSVIYLENQDWENLQNWVGELEF